MSRRQIVVDRAANPKALDDGSRQLDSLTETMAHSDLDLLVQSAIIDGQTQLSYTLHSPSGKVDFSYREIAGPTLSRPPKDYQEYLIAKIAGLTEGHDIHGSLLLAEEIESKLTKIGRELHRELFPAEMREAYREIRRKGVRSVRIVSDEPWIPWELIKPYDDSQPDAVIDDDFICLQFELTRWLSGHPARTPRSELRVRRLACISTAADLPKASRETSFLKKLAQTHSGVEDASPILSSASEAEAFLNAGGIDLLHVVGHGTFDPALPNESALLFPDGSALRPTDLQGPVATRVGQDRPLVFLNVCSAGQQGSSLAQLAGWANRWVRICGCGAFVAPLWPVRDSLAFEFAKVFYGALATGDTYGQAGLSARAAVRRLAPDSPAWLAYAIYADVHGRLTLGDAALPGTSPEPGLAKLDSVVGDRSGRILEAHLPPSAEVDQADVFRPSSGRMSSHSIGQGGAPTSRIDSNGSGPGSRSLTKALAWVLLVIGFLTIAVLAIFRSDFSQCGEGRQLYEGRCVSDEMIDFTTCLQANKLSKALSVTDQRLRSSIGPEFSLRESLEQDFSTLPKEELELVLDVCGQALMKVGVLSARPLVVSSVEIVNEHPAAEGTLVDLDDLRVFWQSDGPPEDIRVFLEGMRTAQRTPEYVVSSSEESVVIDRFDLAPLLFYRGRGEKNRIRAVLKTKTGRVTSRDFYLEVGIKIAVVGMPDKVKVVARIDDRMIHFYDFEAKVLIPFKHELDFLVLDGFEYGQGDRPIERAEDLDWDNIRVTYFGPDDPELVRPEFIGLATGGQ